MATTNTRAAQDLMGEALARAERAKSSPLPTAHPPAPPAAHPEAEAATPVVASVPAPATAKELLATVAEAAPAPTELPSPRAALPVGWEARIDPSTGFIELAFEIQQQLLAALQGELLAVFGSHPHLPFPAENAEGVVIQFQKHRCSLD